MKKNILEKKTGLFYAILVLSALVLSVSYGIFYSITIKYNTSELLISNLVYGIKITSESEDNTNINRTSITVPANEVISCYVTVYSMNDINSKYTLGYKPIVNDNVDNINIVVTGSKRSGWNTTSQKVGSYGSDSNSRTIKVTVENNNDVSAMIDFQAFGGYAYNSVVSIPLESGYYTIAMVDEEIDNSVILTSQIETDTNCTEDICLYGANATSNYLKLSEEDNRLYRVIGSYKIDNNLMTKVILDDIADDINIDDVQNHLENYANTIDDNLVVSLDLLTILEYYKIGGNESYLAINYDFAILDDNGIVKNFNHSTGIIDDNTNSKLRPVLILKSNVSVSGNGTYDDPFIVLEEEKSDINFIGYTYKNEETNISSSIFIEELGKKYSANLVCENGSEAEITSTGKMIYTSLVLPDSCILNFDDKVYTVIGSANYDNFGTVTPTSSIVYGKTTMINIEPAENYYLFSASCTNGYTIENMLTGVTAIGKQTVTILNNSNPSDTVCTFVFKDLECWKIGNSVYAYYTCEDDTCTMQQCRIKSKTGTLCNGGSYGVDKLFPCTYGNTDLNQNYYCNSSLTSVNIYVMGFSKTITRSECL